LKKKGGKKEEKRMRGRPSRSALKVSTDLREGERKRGGKKKLPKEKKRRKKKGESVLIPGISAYLLLPNNMMPAEKRGKRKKS